MQAWCFLIYLDSNPSILLERRLPGTHTYYDREEDFTQGDVGPLVQLKLNSHQSSKEICNLN